MDKILNYDILKDKNGGVFINITGIYVYIDTLSKCDGYVVETEDYEDHSSLGFFKTLEAAVKCIEKYIMSADHIYRWNFISGFNFEDKEIK